MTTPAPTSPASPIATLGVSGAVAMIFLWLLSARGIQPPSDIAAAITLVFGAAGHTIAKFVAWWLTQRGLAALAPTE